MDTTLEEIPTRDRLVHPSNIFLLMVVIPAEMSTLVRPAHWVKVPAPRDTMLDGMVTLVKPVHVEKASSPTS